MLIRNARLFGEDCRFAAADLRTEGSRIAAITPVEAGAQAGKNQPDLAVDSGEPIARDQGYGFSGEVFDAAGLYVIPGLIDIHIHGCAGRDCCDGQPGALPVMGRFLASQGVTTFLPATLSLPEDRLLYAVEEFRAYQRDFAASGEAAAAAGIYMEGPFFAREKRGAHAEEFLTDVSLSLFEHLDAASGGQIRVACVAPEKPGALRFIAANKDRLTLSVAHTMANYDTAVAAFRAGASQVTHLFNAMLPFGHREPGVPGAAFDEGAFVELIADGVHVHPSMLRAAFQLYGAERVILVSDAMAACGMPDGDYRLGNLEVRVESGTARLHNGTIAGSATPLMEALRRAVGFGIPLEDAVRAATLNPARATRIDGEIGSLAAGKQADLVVLNERLEVVRVMLRGQWLQ